MALLAISMLAGTFYYVIVFTMAGSRVEATDVGEDDPLIRIALIYGSSVSVDYLTEAENGFILGFSDSDNNFTEILTTDVTRLNVARDRNLTLNGDRFILSESDEKTEIGSYHIKVVCETEMLYGYLQTVKAAYPEYNVFPAYYDGTYCIMMGHYATEAEAAAELESLIDRLTPDTAPETETDMETESETTTESETDVETTPTVSEDSTGENGEDVPLSSEEITSDVDKDPSDTSLDDSTESGETDTDPLEPGTTEPDTTESDTIESDTTVPDETEPPESVIDPLTEAMLKATVSLPSDTAITAIDPATKSIVWEFDDTTKKTFFAAMAYQNGSTYSYIKGYKGSMRIYDGILECAPYQADDAYGVQAVNILHLETYIAGVIPYEIGNTWPLETQKAFAIAVRSYAIANLGRHKSSYNADLCSSTNCQVYKGFNSTNARVRQAANETKGLIAVYNGTNDICITAYSSSTGGCTASSWDVWGSSRKVYGYLSAVATPWEKYEKYGNGSWTSTATGKQLYERLEAKGYTALTSAVTKIEITKFAENSTYVYAIKFYDKAGHTVEVKQVNKVKSLLSPYVNSGNFVVGKAGSTVTRTNYTMMGFGASNAEPTLGVVVKTNPFEHILYDRQTFSVLTANGTQTFDDSNEEYVATANGTLSFNMTHSLDSNFYPTITGVNGAKLPDIMKLQTLVETETITAEGTSGSFVFIGRGWGHGVGLSQWGIKDLGDLGYDYETIFKAYYSDVRIVDFQAYLNGAA